MDLWEVGNLGPDIGIISLWEIKFKSFGYTATVYELCCWPAVAPRNQKDLSCLVNSFSGTAAQAAEDCHREMSRFGINRLSSQVKSSEVHSYGYSSAFPRTRTRPAVSQLCFETIPYPHLPHGYLPTVL